MSQSRRLPAAALGLALGLGLAAASTASARAEGGNGGATAAVEATFIPRPAEFSAAMHLAAAHAAIERLAYQTDAQERQLTYDLAIESLTALYQLHGVSWAGEPLARIYSTSDCPDLHLGYSADGRVLLRIEPLTLHNPAFAGYIIYLCTLESHSSRELTAARTGSLTFTLRNGGALVAQPLTRAHPLWPQVSKLADTFSAPLVVSPGRGVAFKQVFARALADGRKLSPSLISAVSLSWGRYVITVPYPTREVEHD